MLVFVSSIVKEIECREGKGSRWGQKRVKSLRIRKYIAVTLMHKKWLNRTSTDGFEPYHPKFLGFEKALEKLRKRSSDHVKSVARIPLPHPVLSHIEKITI